ncbi:MAG: pmbA [Gammaproteobacteria bacterium]|nr:pmbA [Gammaproteobacteria bacterium]
MNESQNNRARLIETAIKTLDYARQAGASAAEVDIGTGQGLSVTVRLGEVETIEHQRDKGMGITVYLGNHKSSASTTDFSDQALLDTVQAAVAMARYASADDCAGLLAPEYLARTVPDLDLCHPWDIAPEAAIELAVACEDAARQADSRIVNADGTVLNSYGGSHVYGNSHGFTGGWDWTSHSLECAVIAEQDGKMQRDGWYTSARDHSEMEAGPAVGRCAAQRTVTRLGARKVPTCNVPVIFEAPVAKGLLGAFLAAIAGGALYRKASFLLDRLGQEVFAGHINISERPHLPKGPGSAPFDSDGMATRDRDLVSNGILNGYLLSAYSARKLGLAPTGNAGGVHNLILETGKRDLNGLIKQMHRGLLITDMIGFGVNNVTGDYSRGASGLWIEQGQIQFPVEEITVAGNLTDMYRRIVEVGNDVDRRGNIQTGSLLIENMMVAGT